MKRNGLLAAVLAAGFALALVFAPPLTAQEDAKLEADAKKAFDAGRFKEAGDKYAKAAEAAGVPVERQADLHLQSAWSYYIAGNSKRAREELKAAVTARPDLQVIPDFYSPDFANLAGAVRAEVAASNVPAYDVEELKRSARAKLADGKAEEALQDLKRASTSRDPEVFRIQAEASERLGRTADAEAARQRAAELEKGAVSSAPIGAPLDAGVPVNGVAPYVPAVAPLLESAEKSLASGDYRAGASYARQASEADPKSAEAHRLLGDASLLGGQGAEAEREFTAAIVLEPGNTKAVFGLATLAEQQKKWNTAASLYRRVLDLDPNNGAAARGLGRSLNELGDKSAARIAYGRAIENDPASAESRNDFGVFLFRADETDRSVEELIEAVRLDGSKAVYHENLGRAYRKKGMAKEAERELAEAARLAPNDAAVWTALGHVRADQKELDEAATAFATALSLDPASEDAATALGSVLVAAGKLDQAEAALTKAIEGNTKSPVLWNNLGAVRVRRGNTAGAIEAFQKALTMDAGFDAARANLARATELAALEKAAS
ncbi:MAG: tetratricopeptide repeat protein [Thermoanaerobaculia bacterium]